MQVEFNYHPKHAILFTNAYTRIYSLFVILYFHTRISIFICVCICVYLHKYEHFQKKFNSSKENLPKTFFECRMFRLLIFVSTDITTRDICGYLNFAFFFAKIYLKLKNIEKEFFFYAFYKFSYISLKTVIIDCQNILHSKKFLVKFPCWNQIFL